jgi:hypothetical protein
VALGIIRRRGADPPFLVSTRRFSLRRADAGVAAEERVARNDEKGENGENGESAP